MTREQLICTRCGKRLSRKTARQIDSKPVCSTCLFAPSDSVTKARSGETACGLDPKGAGTGAEGNRTPPSIEDSPMNQSTEVAGLKPCPFCGGEGILRISKYAVWVSCSNCWAEEGRKFDLDAEAEAIAAWNTRSQPTPTEAPEPLAERAAEHLQQARECLLGGAPGTTSLALDEIDDARAALTASIPDAALEGEPIECASTHCKRRQECASPSDCTGNAAGKASAVRQKPGHYCSHEWMLDYEERILAAEMETERLKKRLAALSSITTTEAGVTIRATEAHALALENWWANYPLSKADAASSCRSPELCFQYNEWVRCGPCGIKLRDRASQPSVEREKVVAWQDIASAPKDGTWIDIWLNSPAIAAGGFRMTGVTWFEGAWRQNIDDLDSDRDGYLWIPRFGPSIPAETELCKATHWMVVEGPPALATPVGVGDED